MEESTGKNRAYWAAKTESSRNRERAFICLLSKRSKKQIK